MLCRFFSSISYLSVLSLLGFACTAELAPVPGDDGKADDVANELSGDFELPEPGQADGPLSAYQTESELDEAGKADALELRLEHEEIYGTTDPPQEGGLRPVAEWEHVDGVLVAWDDTMDSYLYELITALQQQTNVYVVTDSLHTSEALERDFTRLGLDTNRVHFFEYAHEAFWTRDFGPIGVELSDGRPAFIDLGYYWNRRRDDAVPTLMGAYFNVPVYRPPLLSEGGNFMTNGEGVCAVTRWMLQENPDYSDTQLSNEMSRYLGCQHTIIVERMDGEGTGHIDMFAKFTQPDTVLVGQYDARVEPTNAAILDRVAEQFADVVLSDGRPLRVVRIPMPSASHPVYRSYTNSLFVNNTVLMPTYNTDRHLEEAAVLAYLEALPAGWQVIKVDSSDVIQRGGAVHCTTMTFNIGSISSGIVASPEVTPERYGANSDQPIRDNQTSTSVIVVPADAEGATGTVEMHLAIQHSYVGDLYIRLNHNDVTWVVYDGSGAGQDLFETFTTDTYRETSRTGDWTLTVEDRAIADEGQLVGWSIGFQP